MKLFDVCSTTRHTLKSFDAIRPYILLAGRKTDAEWPRLNRFNPDGKYQIMSSASKTDTSPRRTVTVVVKVSGFDRAHCTLQIRKLQYVFLNLRINLTNDIFSKNLQKQSLEQLSPQGYYLRGLYRSSDDWLHNIEYGKCCKPANHPYWWGHCYEQSVLTSFDNKGTSKCNDGYFMTGLYRGGCDRLYCIEKFKCCKMYPGKYKFSTE